MMDDRDRDLRPLVERLEAERPVPDAAFRGELRRRLLGRAVGPGPAPARLRLLVTAYAGAGSLLLVLAAVGVAGVGPLAAS
jgi:hypothetical protein